MDGASMTVRELKQLESSAKRGHPQQQHLHQQLHQGQLQLPNWTIEFKI
jgi:hypothetical protein